MTDGEDPQGGRALHTEDARGQPVDLLDPWAMHLLHRYNVIEAEPLREIAQEVGPGVSKWVGRVCRIGFAVGLASVASTVLIRAQSVAGLRLVGIGDVIIISFFLIFFGGFYLHLSRARRTRLQRAYVAMLKYRRCPHCGYDLRMLPTDPVDGTTVCPECGFAWRMPDDAEDGGAVCPHCGGTGRLDGPRIAEEERCG